MGYRNQTFKGLGWMTALTGLTKVIALVKIAVLARILSPSQFGAYGIALLVLGLLEMLTETGINIFLIQQKEGMEKYLNSAWVVSVFRGLIIALIILTASPFILIFFKTPEIADLLFLIAAVALTRGLINPMVVVFQKQLEFSKLFLFRGGLYVFDAAAAVLLAFYTKNESSMIYGMLFAAMLEVILSFTLFKVIPKFKFEKEKFMEVINSGKWITGAGVFSYLFQNLDNIVVGRVLGTSSLGFYQQSYSIATLPVSGVSDIFNRVLFPVFVKMSDDLDKLKKSFYKSAGIVVLISFLFGLLIYFFAHPIILVFLGEKWLEIEPTLKVLAYFGILKSILNSSYSMFLSMKMQKTVMLSEMFGIAGMAITILPLVKTYGTVGAGYAAIIGVLISLPVVLYNVKKLFENKK
jgi:lipopolysaccharide exporter